MSLRWTVQRGDADGATSMSSHTHVSFATVKEQKSIYTDGSSIGCSFPVCYPFTCQRLKIRDEDDGQSGSISWLVYQCALKVVQQKPDGQGRIIINMTGQKLSWITYSFKDTGDAKGRLVWDCREPFLSRVCVESAG
jgi:hypothetical protein